MNDKKDNVQGGDADFNEIWGNFQLLPWKWADELVRRSRYLVGAGLLVYAFLVIITIFPGDSDVIALEDYASANLVVLALLVAIVFIVRWRHKIPQFFQWLLNGKRLQPQNGDLKNEFKQYLHDYQQALLSKPGSLTVSIFLIVLLLFLIIRAAYASLYL